MVELAEWKPEWTKPWTRQRHFQARLEILRYHQSWHENKPPDLYIPAKTFQDLNDATVEIKRLQFRLESVEAVLIAAHDLFEIGKRATEGHANYAHFMAAMQAYANEYGAMKLRETHEAEEEAKK